MAITDLSARKKADDVSEQRLTNVEANSLKDRIALLEAEFRLLREECVRTRNLIEEREQKGRTLMDAYKQVISDFADLFEAQRKESLKRDEAIRFLLSSIETRIKADVERVFPTEMVDAKQGRRSFFRGKA